MKTRRLGQRATGNHLARETQLRHDLFGRPLCGHAPTFEQHDAIGKADEALLVRDDDDRVALTSVVNLAERLGQTIEAPQVDACFRLVVDGQLRVAGKHGRDFDALDLTARQVLVDLACQPVS